ncbi:MAG: DUF3102 domain-containing protein [Betaproteobacteria bacterium]
MTKNAMIDLNLLPLETLAEMANEKAEQVERSAKKTVTDAIDCGRYLVAAKEQLEHGQWLAWLGANWNHSRQIAATYMTLASNVKRFTFENAESIRDAMRMIAAEKSEEKEATVPRSERKPADVVVSVPDPDPAPKPPSQRKTAKGSEKVAEDKKPRTQTVAAEILADEPEQSPEVRLKCAIRELSQVLGQIGDSAERKATAKQLRKLADTLDPPTKFAKPDLDDVSSYFAELKAVDAESFFDFYESKGWLVGKVSMKDWRASARKWVRENQSNGKGHSNGKSTNNGRRGLTAEEVFG